MMSYNTFPEARINVVKAVSDGFLQKNTKYVIGSCNYDAVKCDRSSYAVTLLHDNDRSNYEHAI